MYIQTSKSQIKGKTYECRTVRESYRTPQGPRSRLICNISKLPEYVQDAIAALLKSDSALVDSEALGLAEACDFGGINVLHDAWERFGLERILSGIEDEKQRGRIKSMVFGRILFPGSKLSLQSRAAGTALAASCALQEEDLQEDLLYSAMDTLNGNWVAVEKGLYAEAFAEQDVTLVLYDLTSSYFEAQGPAHLAQYGHSRDHRADRRQMILALACDSAGVPIHMEVLNGNRADSTTLLPLLATLRRRFGIKNAIFSFDGGMSSRLNLQQMRDDELDYVTRLSSSTFLSLLHELPTDCQPELWDRDRLGEFELNGTRYIVAGSEFRRHRDVERRECRIQKALAALEKFNSACRKKVDEQKLASSVGRTLERLKAHKYFDFRIETNGHCAWSLREEVIADESRLDGWYLLTTTVSAAAAPKETVFRHYRNLLEVEDAFREVKTYLEMRPIFHYRIDRVRNHIRLCFLAYWISARLKREWNALQETREVPLVLRELQQIRIGKLRLGKKPAKALMTDIPRKLNATLVKLNLLSLFQTIPSGQCSKNFPLLEQDSAIFSGSQATARFRERIANSTPAPSI